MTLCERVLSAFIAQILIHFQHMLVLLVHDLRNVCQECKVFTLLVCRTSWMALIAVLVKQHVLLWTHATWGCSLTSALSAYYCLPMQKYVAFLDLGSGMSEAAMDRWASCGTVPGMSALSLCGDKDPQLCSFKFYEIQ